MKLLAKFNLVFVFVFGAGLAVAAYLSHDFLRDNARDEVVQQARLMIQMAQSARDYTTNQIKPLLVTSDQHAKDFLPQTVPAFAATESFKYLRSTYPDYEYKEAALNPTNLRDRAVEWEADIINNFRNHSESHELVGVRNAATGPSLYLARPIVANQPCLDCHDRPRAAPIAMIRHYGTVNGFGWKAGEVIGAQIVSVPTSVPMRMADSAFRLMLIYMGAIFFISLVLLDLLLIVTIVRPVGRLSAMADKISLGDLDVPELPVKGKDEISVLAGSFNRMRRSLSRALNLLNEQ